MRTKAVLTLDLKALSRLISLDERSRTATFEAGVLGPELERVLNARGYSLGHFPQSFEFSTLGGWVAARSAGQNSSRYGKIEDMVESLVMAHPGGRFEVGAVPARASGPEWRELLVGSEGVLGVITEATVRVHPLPEATDYRGLIFKSFADGLEAAREMVQSDVQPTILRMNDADYTDMAFKTLSLGKQLGPLADPAMDVFKGGLKVLGYPLPGACLMLLGFEGTEASVDYQKEQSIEICRRHGARSLGTAPGKAWFKERFEHPYLRDEMMDRGMLIETLETAINWGKLDELYLKVRGAVTGAIREGGTNPVVLTHCSHVYPEGGSLYFTFMTAAQSAGAELDQWTAIKEAAGAAIGEVGATISHHHGVGMDHARWMAAERGPAAMRAFEAVKAELDPKGIMNPGKLGV